MNERITTNRWPDWLTAISNVIFTVSLIPAVAADLPPAWETSAGTLVALAMLTAVYLHFKLWWGTAWNVACAGCWAALLVQAVS